MTTAIEHGVRESEPNGALSRVALPEADDGDSGLARIETASTWVGEHGRVYDFRPLLGQLDDAFSRRVATVFATSASGHAKATANSEFHEALAFLSWLAAQSGKGSQAANVAMDPGKSDVASWEDAAGSIAG